MIKAEAEVTGADVPPAVEAEVTGADVPPAVEVSNLKCLNYSFMVCVVLL